MVGSHHYKAGSEQPQRATQTAPANDVRSYTGPIDLHDGAHQ